MLIKKKYFIVLIVSLIFCLAINSVASASFYVNNDTTHKQITDWIDNKAIKGDKLIFNTSSYKLNETIIVNKPIYVGSYKNTEIIMNSNFSMFNVKTNAVNFIGLNLINNGKTEYFEDGWPAISCAIESYYENLNFNMKNVNITASCGIYLAHIKGTISNCKFTVSRTAIMSSYWKGNLVNTEINSKEYGIKTQDLGTHSDESLRWTGNVINSKINSLRESIDCGYWKGTISGSRLYSYGTGTNGIWTFKAPSLELGYSQGIIRKSIIRSNSNSAIHAKKTVKITNTKLLSKNGHLTKYYYRPDLVNGMKNVKGKYNYCEIINYGYENSKSCYLAYKYGKTIKKVYVPPINSGKSVWVKILVPHNSKIKIKIDYYNNIKEENEKNNYDTFKSY